MSVIEDYYDVSRFSDDHLAMLRLANELVPAHGRRRFDSKASAYARWQNGVAVGRILTQEAL